MKLRFFSLVLSVLFSNFINAQKFRPELRVNYLFGIELMSNELLDFTNYYAQFTLDPQQVTSNGPFLAAQTSPAYSSFRIDAGSSLGKSFYLHAQFGVTNGFFQRSVQTGQTFYKRSIFQQEYGLNVGYRFTPEKSSTMFVALGGAFITRRDIIDFENTFESHESDLSMRINQTALGAWLEFGREYTILEQFKAAWFFQFRSMITSFNSAEIQSFRINGGDNLPNLNTRESSFVFSDKADDPTDSNQPRALPNRNDWLGSIMIGVRVGYTF